MSWKAAGRIRVFPGMQLSDWQHPPCVSCSLTDRPAAVGFDLLSGCTAEPPLRSSPPPPPKKKQHDGTDVSCRDLSLYRSFGPVLCCCERIEKFAHERRAWLPQKYWSDGKHWRGVGFQSLLPSLWCSGVSFSNIPTVIYIPF